jgi:sulfate transport system substrate-binding protein
MERLVKRTVNLLAALLLLAANAASAEGEKVELLNASYDVARELFVQVNPAFQAAWLKDKKQAIEIRQSHGGSSKQARAVVDGLAADVVTFNQATDIDFLAKSGLVATDWSRKFANNSSPYYSLPVFLVRGGNPKGIKDWDDLARAGIQPVFPNPKTSGNGRYTYLSAYAYALRKFNGDEAKSNELVAALLANVPVFDTGGRGATTTFIEREIGDVLVTFESEVIAVRNEYSKAAVDVVYPSLSLRVDFPVAVVDKVVDRRGTREAATAYLQFLYSEQGQEILAKQYFRVRSAAVAARHQSQFPKVQLASVEETFGGWDNVTAKHFGTSGILDQLLGAKR